MIRQLKALKNAFLTASAAAYISASEPSERQKDYQMDELLARASFVFPNPQIKGIQLHHVKDSNGDGKIQFPEEVVRIYLDSSTKYNLRIKDPIPGEGDLRVYIPQHHYWGTSIDVIVRDHSKPLNSRPLTRTNFLDLTSINKTNSYEGKPQGVLLLQIEEYKKLQEEKNKAPFTNKITYQITAIGKNGSSHSCIYTIDYSKGSSLSTNTLTAIIPKP